MDNRIGTAYPGNKRGRLTLERGRLTLLLAHDTYGDVSYIITGASNCLFCNPGTFINSSGNLVASIVCLLFE